MKKIISAAGLAILASTATAQIANFEGVSAAVNLNSVSSSIKLTTDNVIDGIGQQSFNGGIQASYGVVISPSSVVSFGVGYGLGKSKSGKLIDDDDSTASFSVKNQLSIYLEPGFLVSNSTLLYGKVSYERAKATSTFTGAPDFSKTVSGTGLGFGIRTMLDKSRFIQVEVRQANFKSISRGGLTAKAKANVATIGYGLKF